MSLNLALVISGDSSGAKRAATETIGGMQGIQAANDGVTASANRARDAQRQFSGSVTVAASEAQASLANMAANTASNFETMADRINRSLRIGSNVPTLQTPFASDPLRGNDVQAIGAQLDNLRAKYNPMFAVLQNYKAQQADIRQAHALGALSIDEMTAALDRERTAALASIAALKGRSSALHGAPANQNGGNFNTANIAYQLQDIGVTSAMGMSPMMIALQQGPQLSAVFDQMKASGQSVGAGLVGAFTSVLSPVSLATIGITAASAATIQWFMSGEKGADKLEAALKDHSDTLRMLKAQYGELGEASSSMGQIGGAAYTDARARSEIATLKAAIREQSSTVSTKLQGSRGGLFGSDTAGLDELLATKASPFQAELKSLFDTVRLGGDGLVDFDAKLNATFDTMRENTKNLPELNDELMRLSNAALDAFSVKSDFAPFQGEIARLLLGLKEGNGDLTTFAGNVRRIGEIKGIEKGVTDQVILAARETIELAQNLREVETILKRIDRAETRPGLDDSRELVPYVRKRDADQRAQDEQFGADQQLARARTNAERLAAIEEQIRSRRIEDGDTGGGLQARIDRALQEEQTRQQVEARDAADQRSRALSGSLLQQQLELQLIGQTVGEQERLRVEFEGMQELREQAWRTGIPMDEQEIATLKEKAAQYGMVAEAIAKSNLERELAFERSQLGRNSMDAEIAARLQSANQPVDLSSAQAQQIRYNLELARTKAAWEDVRDVGRDAIDRIFDGSADGFEGITDALQDVAKDVLSTFTELSIKNPLKNALYGDNNPTMSTVGGIGGIFSALLGGEMPGLKEAQSVASMSVTAATVVVNGGTGAGGTISRLLDGTAANENNYAPGAVTRAPLGAAIYRDVIASIESAGSGGYSAIGPTHPTLGRALGKYQMMEANVGPWSKAALGQTLSPAQFMANPGSQDAIFDHVFGGYVGKYGERGAAQAWFGGPGSVGKNARSDVLGTTVGGYGDKFMSALERMGGKATTATAAIDDMTTGAIGATDGLGSVATGFDQFGKNLANAFPAAPQGGGGGGLGGWLGKLFGGGGATFASMSAISPMAASYIAGGAPVGTFATGTDYAPEGWAWVGEEGPELRKLRAGDVIRSNPASMKMVANSGSVGRMPYPAPAEVAARASAPGVNIKFVNQSGVALEQEDSRQSVDENGNLQMEVTLRRLAADEISTPGRQGNMMLQKGYGLGRQVVRR